jgi:F-type H+-transporting ATPase subunit epsilon
MAAFFIFEVHTPYRLFFNGRVESVSMTLTDGEIGVYAHHTPSTAPVVSCILRVRDEKGNQRRALIAHGILEVKDHKTVLMVDAAELPEEIDVDRARAAKQKAEDAIHTAARQFDVENAKMKLRRAEYRLKACELRGN